MGHGTFARSHEAGVIDLAFGEKQHAVLENGESEHRDQRADDRELDHRRAALSSIGCQHRSRALVLAVPVRMVQLVPLCNAQGIDCAAGKFKGVDRAAKASPPRIATGIAKAAAPGAQAAYAFGDYATTVEIDDVDGKAHECAMHTGAGRQQHTLAGLQCIPEHQASEARRERSGQPDFEQMCTTRRDERTVDGVSLAHDIFL